MHRKCENFPNTAGLAPVVMVLVLRVPDVFNQRDAPTHSNPLFVIAFSLLLPSLLCRACDGLQAPLSDERAALVYSSVIDDCKAGLSLAERGFEAFNLSARSRLCLVLFGCYR